MNVPRFIRLQSRVNSTIARTEIQKNSIPSKAIPGRLYCPIIGLEIHVQMKTHLKLFSDTSTNPLSLPNEEIALFDVAIPGSLPKLNRKCIELATRAAIGLNAQIHSMSRFDRKHYFYHDLPKGYQITQFHEPFATNGNVCMTEIDGLDYSKSVRIEQVQLETDSGKSLNGLIPGETLLDFNRSGVGVLEIVTAPDMMSVNEALVFLKKVSRVLSHYGVSHYGMENGSFRCDFNVSVQVVGEDSLGTRTELKHIAKFDSVRDCIQYEIDRQIDILDKGKEVISETRAVDLKKGITVLLREKEDGRDYRYMPEPDLPIIRISPRYIEDVKASLPESLESVQSRLASQYHLPSHLIETLMNAPMAVEFFEKAAVGNISPVTLANWTVGALFGQLKSRDMDLQSCRLSANAFKELVTLVEEEKISALRGKDILSRLLEGSQDAPLTIAETEGWIQDRDQDALQIACKEVIKQYPDVVKKIQNGKPKLVKFFVGEVMKATKGKADPKFALTMLTELLKLDK